MEDNHHPPTKTNHNIQHRENSRHSAWSSPKHLLHILQLTSDDTLIHLLPAIRQTSLSTFLLHFISAHSVTQDSQLSGHPSTWLQNPLLTPAYLTASLAFNPHTSITSLIWPPTSLTHHPSPPKERGALSVRHLPHHAHLNHILNKSKSCKRWSISYSLSMLHEQKQ